jgi:hypothetical protein
VLVHGSGDSASGRVLRSRERASAEPVDNGPVWRSVSGPETSFMRTLPDQGASSRCRNARQAKVRDRRAIVPSPGIARNPHRRPRARGLNTRSALPARHPAKRPLHLASFRSLSRGGEDRTLGRRCRRQTVFETSAYPARRRSWRAIVRRVGPKSERSPSTSPTPAAPRLRGLRRGRSNPVRGLQSPGLRGGPDPPPPSG